MFILQAQAAILSRNGLLQGANPSQHEVMLEKYGNMLRHLQGYVHISIAFHIVKAEAQFVHPHYNPNWLVIRQRACVRLGCNVGDGCINIGL